MKYYDKFHWLAQNIGSNQYPEDKKWEYILSYNIAWNIEEIRKSFERVLDCNSSKTISGLKAVLKFYNHNFIEHEFKDWTKKIAFYSWINSLDEKELIELIERSWYIYKEDEFGISEDFFTKDFLENILHIKEIDFEYALEVQNIKKILNKDITSGYRRNYFKNFPYVEAEFEFRPQYCLWDEVTFWEKTTWIERITMLPDVYWSIHYWDINNLTMNLNQMTWLYLKPSDYQIENISKMLEKYWYKFNWIKQTDRFNNQ